MLLLSTSTLVGYGLHRQLLLAKQAGFEGVDLSLSCGQIDEWSTEYVTEISALVGMPITSISAPEHNMTQELFEKIILLAQNLSAKRIHFFPPSRKDRDDGWFFRALPEFAKSNPPLELLVVNVEPKTLLFFVPEYKDATLPAIKKVTGKTAFSLSSVDPSSGVDLHRSFSLLGNSICNVFVADRSGSQENLLPGTGDLPLASVLSKLTESGYTGDYTIRLSPQEVHVGDDIQKVIEKLQAAQDFVKKNT